MEREYEREYSTEYRSFREISAERRKKRNRLRLQRLFAIVLFAALVSPGFFLAVPSVRAKAESGISYERRIISIRVAENDSLWKIAERFYCKEKESIPDFIEDIRRINHLESDTIYPDTYLVIQYYVKKAA